MEISKNGILRFLLLILFAGFSTFLSYEYNLIFLEPWLQIWVGCIVGAVSSLIIVPINEVLKTKIILKIIGAVLFVGTIAVPLSVEPQMISYSEGPMSTLITWAGIGVLFLLVGMLPGAVVVFFLLWYFVSKRQIKGVAGKVFVGCVVGIAVVVNFLLAFEELAAPCC